MITFVVNNLKIKHQELVNQKLHLLKYYKVTKKNKISSVTYLGAHHFSKA